jgi:dTMP kinase
MENQGLRGKFITVEGSEGVGKSTAMAYMESLLTEANISFITTREPGGTEVAEMIRRLLLAHHEEKICAETELLLMFAGRVQHVRHLIKPTLASGIWVLCDRYVDASYAYQGGGRQIADDKLDFLANWLLADLMPDLTLLLDAPLELSFKRAKNRGELDRIEQEQREFFERVRDKYLALAAANPQRFKIIDASKTIPQVQQLIAAQLTPLFPSSV